MHIVNQKSILIATGDVGADASGFDANFNLDFVPDEIKISVVTTNFNPGTYITSNMFDDFNINQNPNIYFSFINKKQIKGQYAIDFVNLAGDTTLANWYISMHFVFYKYETRKQIKEVIY